MRWLIVLFKDVHSFNIWSVHAILTGPWHTTAHPLGPYSVQSVGAAEAVSLAVGYNPGWVATPTQYTSKLALISPTSEGWQAESTPLMLTQLPAGLELELRTPRIPSHRLNH